MKKPRLAIITTHPIQYNAPLYALLQSRSQVELCVFYTWGKDVLQDKYDPDFGKVINWDIDLLSGYDYQFLDNRSVDKGSHHFKGIDNPQIIEKIEAFQPDAVLVYGWPLKSHLKVMRHFKGKLPVLFRGDSTLLDEQFGWKTFARRVLLKWIYRHVDKALYVGKSNYDYYIKAGLQPAQLLLMPHAIDNNRFHPEYHSDRMEAVHQFRKSRGINETDTVFLFAGKLEQKKNPAGLLDAFMKCEFSSQVHLIFVGNGHLEQELKSKAKNYINIHFIDFINQSDMPLAYQSCDIFVLPSSGPGESWGLAVNEAMASGKAVLVSDKCGCARDLVIPGENGFIFQSYNTAALQQYLKKMACDPSLQKIMGMRSLNQIKEFSFEIQAEVLEKLMYTVRKK